ncbi:MAG: cyclic di-GMP phosphodiesterase [Solirubrobacteraceae bacterium]|jgi:putative two-component system response regulator|nr:cyclic di-GMP phosphodiesterase [Solirubrobacteraceae bacterium]
MHERQPGVGGHGVWDDRWMRGARYTRAATLIVDSDEESRGALRRSLSRAGAPIAALEAHDVAGMLDVADHVQLILLDAALPGPGLRKTLGLLRERHPDVPVVVTSGWNDPEAMRAALDGGASSFVLRSLAPARLRYTVEAALDGDGVLDPQVVRPVLDGYAAVLESARRRDRAIIESLAAAVEAKDTVTSDHVHAVGTLATALATLVDPTLAESEDFLFGCLLHDVGKIGVPEHILAKPGPLDDAEWTIMRLHPETGVRVIGPLGLAPTVSDLVLHHHERWDGGGYPGGLSGGGIPLSARIFSVCDALEAMTARRPYREPVTPAVALAEIRAESGRQFDPGVVDALGEGVQTGRIDLAGTLHAALATG